SPIMSPNTASFRDSGMRNPGSGFLAAATILLIAWAALISDAFSGPVSLTDTSGKTIQAEILWKGDADILVNPEGRNPAHIPFERLSESSRKHVASLPSGWQKKEPPPIGE